MIVDTALGAQPAQAEAIKQGPENREAGAIMQIPEELRALEAYWDMQRGAQPMPRRSAFGPLELRPWLGNIAIVAVERQPALRFRVTLSGARMDDYRGHGITNRYIDEICAGRESSEPFFRRCLDTAAPVYFRFDNSCNSQLYPCMAKLLLPLGNAAGDAIERILVGSYPQAVRLARAA